MDRTRFDAVVDGSVPVPINDHLGFTLEETRAPTDSIAYSWTVPQNYCNSAGNLQGGMLAAFADAALGLATAAHLPEDEYPALAEMKISIFRPAPAGTKLTATGRVLKRGRRVSFTEVEITDESGKLIAKASGTEVPARG